MRRRSITALFLTFLVSASLGAVAVAGSPPPFPPLPAPPPDKSMLAEMAKQAAAQPEAAKNDAARSGPTATAVSRDQAVAIARDVLALPGDLGVPSVSLYTNDQPGTRTTWGLTWQTPPGVQPQRHHSVNVDATNGEVVNYKLGIETPAAGVQPGGELSPQLTREATRAKAQAWVDKLAKSRLGRLTFVNQPNLTPHYELNTNFVFHWDRTSDGIPVSGQGVTLNLNGRSGDLLMYSLNWNEQDELPPPLFYFPREHAATTYADLVNLELTYMQTQPARSAKAEWQLDQPEWRLVYRPRTGPFPVLDALTGRLRHAGDGRVLQPGELGHATDLPAPEQPYQPPTAPLSQAEALAVARAVSGATDAPATVNFNESGGPNPRQVYHFGWSIKDPEGATDPKAASRSVSVAVDALKGVVDAFSSYGPYPSDQEWEQQAAFPKEKAQEQALAFIAAHRPDLAGRLQLVPIATPEDRFFRLPGTAGTGPIRRTYRFQFQYTVNGIPVQNANAAVEVSTITGAVTQFNNADYPLQQPGAPFPGAPFPAGGNVIGADKAMQQLLTAAPLTLRWQTYQDWLAYKFNPRPAKDPPRETVLVWAPDLIASGSAIDAFTGHVLDGSGKDLTEAARPPLDIAGHRYQQEIELLLAREIMGQTEGRFNPEGTVTRAEAIRWLAQARDIRAYRAPSRFSFGEGDSLPAGKAAHIQAAYDAGLVVAAEEGPRFRPDEPVTRAEFALWAVRAMGYGAVAAMDATVSMHYADADAVPPRYRNAVALLAGLKVLPQGVDVAFDPQGHLRRGDAARILFTVLTRPR